MVIEKILMYIRVYQILPLLQRFFTKWPFRVFLQHLMKTICLSFGEDPSLVVSPRRLTYDKQQWFINILSGSHFILPSLTNSQTPHKNKRLETWSSGPTLHSLTHKALNSQEEHYQEDLEDEEEWLNPKTQKIWPPKIEKVISYFYT